MTISFADLDLRPELLTTLEELGYSEPTPVQAATIPFLLKHRDVLAQAQTGTGKTAAFALPILNKLNTEIKQPQALIITPTRELTIQVAEAFKRYASELAKIRCVPIYGGGDYQTQLKSLKRGAHVIIGTPGRLMDHLRRETIKLDAVQTVVLDEADEMLNMGFIEDIEWILQQIPHKHQSALFSATMPKPILKIVDNYLHKAEKVFIEACHKSLSRIEQSYFRIHNKHKLDVLLRLLEVEDIDAGIIFTRTRGGSNELAEKLQARGYKAAALNGDMSQALRKTVIEKAKSGAIDYLVATDVAARGIDIPRITHVFNFDIPGDSETYTHRIGRTGRAGRQGKSFLLITPKEQRMLEQIERDTHSQMSLKDVPTAAELQEQRDRAFADRVFGLLEKNSRLARHRHLVNKLIQHDAYTFEDIAAALCRLAQNQQPPISHDIETPAPEFNHKKNNSRPRFAKNKGRRGKPESRRRR